jgi:cytochrome c oxidase subunit 2
MPRPLPDGIVPEEEVARTENRWLIIMGGMLGVMMALVVVTGVTNALHPPSNVETVDPTTSAANSPKAISALPWSPTVLLRSA